MAGKDKKEFQNKTIVIVIKETEYVKFIDNNEYARKIIDKEINAYPELFPNDILTKGYILNGVTRISEKIGYTLRKIKIGDKQKFFLLFIDF